MGDYVGAPYNFVPFGKKVYRKDEIVKHNQIQGLSGYIEYQVTAQTPIMVDGGDKHFYRDKDGKAAIPGSTMRGLVRSNMQVLSQSSFVDDIKNERFMYRCVGGSKKDLNSNIYKHTLNSKQAIFQDGKMTVLKNVKGGYIRNQNGQYYLIPSKIERIDPKKLGNMNYYVLSERQIIENQFKGFEMLKRSNGILQHTNTTHFKEEKRDDGLHYVGEKNEKYVPRTEEVYYQLKGTRNIIALSAEPKPKYQKGTMLTSGFMSEKKVFYVIPEIDVRKPQIRIPESDIDVFMRDFRGKEKQLIMASGADVSKLSDAKREEVEEKVLKFFSLPENGETKPVFYIELDGKIYFGFTPRLRLFYDKDIYDGLTKEQKDNSLDYCKSMFGFTSDKKSYRSRLSFQDATMDNGMTEGEKETRVLAEPKPTSYLDYLMGEDGTAATYRDNFQLRGMKQYWLHKELVKGKLGTNENVESDFYPYPKGASFTGRIRFQNLSEVELGMLLWSLLLEKDSQQNIGKGKAYGFGRVNISLKQLQVMDIQALYSSDQICLDPYQSQKGRCEEYIDKAKKDMTRFLNEDVMKYPPVRDFLLMKNQDEMPRESAIRYMELSNKEEGRDSEYQKRVKNAIPLDTIGVVLGKEARRRPVGNRNENGSNWNNSNQKDNKGGAKPNQNQKNGKTQGNYKKDKPSNEYKDSGNATTSMGSLFANLKF